MISDKRHIQQLAALLLKKGITDIVISPGSRNAPMINTFTGTEGFTCRNIVDERSAGYFALGLALKNQRPVVLVCSSGTATLNYTPAVA
ncbi:MAG TPA: thiamine pyrophosphate-binding protein, partial [Prolixibacteraceae bacterium]|nr:thiamine pyrophosphate-binding protein [Prolixibacteraceae bacterium]